MEYRILLTQQEYRSMKPKEANEYFLWFLEQVSSEIEKLDAIVRKEVVLDFSPESLKPLESCFLSLKKYEKKSKQDILTSYANAPSYILEEMLRKRYAPTPETVELATKIALYLGEVFVRNNHGLHWDYVKRPKTDVYYNVPGVFGFSPPTMKFKAFVTVFSWCIPAYSSSPQGDKNIKTWFEWYQHWLGEKEIYWSPDYTPQKYLKIMMERQKKN